MAKVTFEEVRLMNEGKPISPQVMSGSVKNLDGTPYTNHNHDDRYYTETEIDDKLSKKTDQGHKHTKSDITDFDHNHDDKYYTKSEIDSKFNSKFKNYTLSTDIISQSTYMTVNLEVGDSAYISGSYDIPANRTFDIRSQVAGGVFFVAMIDGADNRCYIREDLAGLYIVRIQNDRSSTWGDTARIYIRRLK